MGIGANLTPSTAGSVTAPTTGFPAFTIPAALSVKTNPHAMVSVVDLPEIRGQMLFDGISATRHVVTNVLRTGPLAPSTAPTATPTAARAEAWLIFTGQPADNDGFTVKNGYVSSQTVPSVVYFKTALDTTKLDPFCTAAPANQILIGVDLATTLQNLYDFFNGVGSQGNTWYSGLLAYGLNPYDWESVFSVECYEVTATTAKFRVVEWGAIGNNYYAGEALAGVNPVTNGAFYKKDGVTAIAPATTFADGAYGTGSNPGAGTYDYAYQYLRTEDGGLSGQSPTEQVIVGSNGAVALTAMTASGDADVDYTRWNRTAVGGNVYYRGYDVAVAATLDTDDRPDEDITAEGGVAYDPTIYRTYEAGYPPKCRYGARYKGRVFGGGALLAADTPTFVANVTAGSRTVPLVSGNPTKDWEGRALHLDALGEPYRIIKVDPTATGTLYLEREAEATDTTTNYVVKDDRDPYELFYSEPLLPNNWPVGNSIKGVSGTRGTGITGMIEAWESLVVFTEEGVWRLTGDGPGSFQIHQAVKGSGCVSGHTVKMVDGLLYWLGHSAIYAWSGSGEPVAVSSPPTEGGSVRGIEDTMARLNLHHAARSHAHYDPDNRILRFFVPMDNDVTNRYAIVLDIQTGTFSLDTCEDWTCVETVRKPNGQACTLAGDVCGIVWQDGIGNCDGAFGDEPRKTFVSWSANDAMELTTTPAFTSDIEGVPVWYWDSSGNIVRLRAVSTGATAVTLARHLPTPAIDPYYPYFGAIPLWLRTGRFDGGAPNIEKTVAAMRLFFDVDGDGEVFVAWAKNQGTPTCRVVDPTVDLTTSDGERRIKVQLDGRSHQLEILAIEPGCDPHLLGYTLEYRGLGGGGE